MSSTVVHPREVLLEGRSSSGQLPVCDHYCGVEPRMSKALNLQRELIAELGVCAFDVTLDCEDGAPVGGEHDHAQTVLALARGAMNAASEQALPATPRVAVRVHAVDHPAFDQDIVQLLGQGAASFCHVMVPKVESVVDVRRAIQALDAVGASEMPLHVLIESAHAVSQVQAIASEPRVQSISFGVMDFVSSHNGAIGAWAMAHPGQFTHPLVRRAKLEISAACHAFGKVPSHCVITEFKDAEVIASAAKMAASELGYTRMWSIHPHQIRPILAAFQPDASEVDAAVQVIEAAAAAQWGPVSVQGRLHDRASFRYFWQLLERAHATGVILPAPLAQWCATGPSSGH